METLLPYLVDWFSKKEQYLKIFAKADSRLEGWFKGELLVLFTKLMQEGVIDNFSREASVVSFEDGKRKQIDFKITINGQENLCELKAPCISQAAGTPRNLRFYFSENDLGLFKDFKKLDQIQAKNKWGVAFIYPRPDFGEWRKTISTIPTYLHNWQPITKPEDFDNYLFISLWKRRPK